MSAADPESGARFHLSGCWIVDEDVAAADNAATMAILFLGKDVMIYLDLFERAGQPPVTETRVHIYWLEGNRIFVAAPPFPEDTIWEQDWELTDGNVLFLEIGRDWVPFYPTTIKQLIDRGFERERIDTHLTVSEMTEETFYEEPPYLRRTSSKV